LTSPSRFDKASFTLLLLGGIAMSILLGGCVVAVYLSAYGSEDFLNDPFFYLVFYLFLILAFTLFVLGAYFDARDQVNGPGHRRNNVVAALFAGIALFEVIALPISEFRGEQDKITYATYTREKWLTHKEKIYRASMIKDFVKQVSLPGPKRREGDLLLRRARSGKRFRSRRRLPSGSISWMEFGMESALTRLL
jgi:heme A synthase